MDMLTASQIAAIRRALNMSPTEFAFRLGVSASAVCYWEKGLRHPKFDTMKKINNLARKAKLEVPA
jgi:DNA-binding transcriptional regulator YiaG